MSLFASLLLSFMAQTFEPQCDVTSVLTSMPPIPEETCVIRIPNGGRFAWERRAYERVEYSAPLGLRFVDRRGVWWE